MMVAFVDAELYSLELTPQEVDVDAAGADAERPEDIADDDDGGGDDDDDDLDKVDQYKALLVTREAELARKDAEIAALKERLARASLPSKTDDAASHGDIVKPPRELFVSPVGSDTAVGTSAAAPLRTLAHARDTARRLRAAGNVVMVNLLDGVFRLDAPLVFTPEDSGTAWRSAPQNSAATASNAEVVYLISWRVFKQRSGARQPKYLVVWVAARARQ